MVKLRGKAWWKNFFGKIWLSYHVEKLGGNLVLNVFFFKGQIGRNSLVEKSMDKMYWKN